MEKRIFVAALAIVSLFFVSGVQAALVTYTLTDYMNGTFDVTAAVSPGDNFGLVTYGVPLVGNVATIDHVSPNTMYAMNAAFVGGTAGFTSLRSADGNPALTGAQDTIAPTPHLIRGLGQKPGSFAELALNPVAPAEQADWGFPLLLATGTYTGAFDIGFDVGAATLLANVFVEDAGIATAAAEVATVVTVIPEPSTFAILGIALIGLGAFLRKR